MRGEDEGVGLHAVRRAVWYGSSAGQHAAHAGVAA